MRKSNDPQPPAGITRLLFRLPTVLYRLRLGWLLASRFLLVDHVGRISGQHRQVVLEVVEHDAGAGLYTIVSGYGTRAGWYRNLRKNPNVTITVGRRRMAAVAVPVTAAEGGEILLRYAKRHPVAIRGLMRFTGFEADGSDADYRLIGQRLLFLRLVPAAGAPREPEDGTARPAPERDPRASRQ
jgi:deazaflavin-dependent oxidoreductase (nitroreductase family)